MLGRSFNTYFVERIKRENELEKVDKSKWYQVNKTCLTPELQNKFHQLFYDKGTDDFIARCYQKSDSLLTLIFYSIARSVLRIFLSSTSICGLLGCGSMFVFSEEQFKSFVFSSPLLSTDPNRPTSTQSSIRYRQYGTNNFASFNSCSGEHGSKTVDSIAQHGEICAINIPSDQNCLTLLDLGAGDGMVTSVLAKNFSCTYATEISRFMQKRLLKRNFKILGIDDWHLSGIKFDMISCLNLLDRCDQPIQILANIRRCLVDSGGVLLLALVLPMCQYVEYKNDHQPEEILPVRGATFEHQVVSFHQNVVIPCGFEVIRWTKLPYLSEGNLDLTYFWLIDSVFLLRPSGT